MYARSMLSIILMIFLLHINSTVKLISTNDIILQINIKNVISHHNDTVYEIKLMNGSTTKA